MLAFLLWIFGVLFIFISAKYVPVKKMGKFDIDANIKVLTATAFLTGMSDPLSCQGILDY